MYKKKIYGSYRKESCPFCERTATILNSQKLPVCHQHKTAILGEVKCACGDYLDIMDGKYGAFFNCMNCGPQNIQKILAINHVKDVSEQSVSSLQNNSSLQKSFSSSPFSKKKSFSPSKSSSKSSSQFSSKNNLPKMYSGHEETISSDDPRYF